MPCNLGYRAGSDRVNASRSFNVTCSSDCSYTQGVECVAVSCGVLQLPRVKLPYWPRPYLPSTFDFQERASQGDGEFNTSIFPYESPSSLPHVHGESVRVRCAPGTRSSNMSACGASATSFDVTCWDGLYLQVMRLSRTGMPCTREKGCHVRERKEGAAERARKTFFPRNSSLRD